MLRLGILRALRARGSMEVFSVSAALAPEGLVGRAAGFARPRPVVENTGSRIQYL